MKKYMYAILVLVMIQCKSVLAVSVFLGISGQTSLMADFEQVPHKGLVFGPTIGHSSLIASAGPSLGIGLTKDIQSKVIPRLFLRAMFGSYIYHAREYPAFLGLYGGFDTMFRIASTQNRVFHLFIGASGGGEMISDWDFERETRQLKVLGRVGLSMAVLYSDSRPGNLELALEIPIVTQHRPGGSSIPVVDRSVIFMASYNFIF